MSICALPYVAVRGGRSAAVAIAACSFVSAASAQWTEWGGPNRDFNVKPVKTIDPWGEKGPRTIWTREDVKDGYSGILAENGKLYTMARADDQETVLCLNAADGATIWEHRYAVEIPAKHEKQFGIGPRGTPLILGDKLYAVGVAGNFHCLEKATGKVKWAHDLLKDYGGSVLQHGYSSSPMAYKDTIILPVGGEGHAFMAFAQSDGAVKWKSADFGNSYSSPKIIRIDGQPQLVCFMADELSGINPDTGAVLWRHPFSNQYKQNVMMPIWGDDNLLFFSAPQSGSIVMKLTVKDGKTNLEEVWSNKKLQVYHATAVRIGDYVYGSSGTLGPAFMFGVNVKTGEVAWRHRGIAKATFLNAAGRFIILDERGNLALADPSPKELKVLSSTQMLEESAWTIPTLDGTRLYVRDLKKLMALDLGTSAGGKPSAS